MSAEADAQKLELLRTALPKGFSAGDGGLGGFNSKEQVPSYQWPAFSSSTADFRVDSLTPSETVGISTPSQQSSVFAPHPWQIRLGTDIDGNTTYLVEFNSKLYSGIGSWTNIAITGLDSAATISEGYLILFGVVSGGVCTEASIQGPQSVVSDRIDFAGSDQISFAVQLGYLYQDGAGWVVLQQAFQDLTLMSVCVDGKAAIYPMAI
jgi:hypothetical protein